MVVKMKKKAFKRIFSAVLCCSVMIPVLCFQAFAQKPSFTGDEEWEVLRLTNYERTANGLAPLSVFSELDAAAGLRAEEITTLFSHTRPDGTPCSTALGDIPYYSVGENIAYGYPTPEAVVEGWMNSPGHRANILTEHYRHLGVGYISGAWTQLFIGGCTTTDIAVSGASEELQLSLGDDVGSMGLVLEITCDMHGTSYLPLENAEYSCDTGSLGETVLSVSYGGKSVSIPAFVNFTDVKGGAWYYNEVRYAWEKNLFNGMTETTFEPDTAMSRAMLVTVIYRLEGEPQSDAEHSFADVPNGEWYSEAVKWAAEQGIVNGVSPTEFDPESEVTREQTATILYRYSVYKESDDKESDDENLGDISVFTDNEKVSEYATDSVKWAVGLGLIKGTDDNKLDPQGNATRAQIATILMRYIGEDEVETDIE